MSSSRELLLPIYHKKPQDHCGVVAITHSEDPASDAFFALFALQHRGQESAGITVSDGEELKTHKEMGLVASVFREEDIARLSGQNAIGHTRYSTSKGSKVEHSGPVNLEPGFSLAHNGNLPQTWMLEEFADSKGIDTNNLNDSELMYVAINYYRKRGASLPEAIVEARPFFGKGVFAGIGMDMKSVVAFQDDCAMKPLSLGRLNGGYAIASETCALDTIGAKFARDIEPAEMVVIDENGLKSYQVGNPDKKRDSWEFVYFAHPGSVIDNRSVYDVRNKAGLILAQEHPVRADLVLPVLDSGSTAAIGYAYQSGLPYHELMPKNRYIGRTFIQPNQRLRDNGVKLKHTPIRNLLEGKSIVVVDDSIVRGTTTPKIVKMLREVGVDKIHLRIAAPPYKYNDYYGTDTPIQGDLVASYMSIEEIRELTGADSLGYLSYEGLLKAIDLPEDQLSTSWYTGVYPVPVPSSRQLVTV